MVSNFTKDTRNCLNELSTNSTFCRFLKEHFNTSFEQESLKQTETLLNKLANFSLFLLTTQTDRCSRINALLREFTSLPTIDFLKKSQPLELEPIQFTVKSTLSVIPEKIGDSDAFVSKTNLKSPRRKIAKPQMVKYIEITDSFGQKQERQPELVDETRNLIDKLADSQTYLCLSVREQKQLLALLNKVMLDRDKTSRAQEEWKEKTKIVEIKVKEKEALIGVIEKKVIELESKMEFYKERREESKREFSTKLNMVVNDSF